MLLVSLSGVAVLSLNMFLPALPRIATDLGVDYATANWAVSGYLALTAAILLVAGPLSDRVGRRPVVLGALSAFCLACLACALAPGFGPFLAARLLMGAVIACSAMSMTAVRDTSEGAEAARRLSWVATGMAVGPMIGPMLGGFIAGALGWRGIFAALGLAGAALLVWAARSFGETRAARSGQSLTGELPHLIRARRFWAYAGSVMFGIGCFFVFIAGAPLVAVQVFGMPIEAVGLAVGIITGGFFAGTITSGRIAARVGVPGMVLAGRLSAVLGLTLSGLFLATGVASPYTYFGCVMLVGYGNGLGTPSANVGLMSVRPSLSGTAAGVSGAMTLAGGAALTALSARSLVEGDPLWRLWGAMMLVALAGLACALAAWSLERRAAATAS